MRPAQPFPGSKKRRRMLAAPSLPAETAGEGIEAIFLSGADVLLEGGACWVRLPGGEDCGNTCTAGT